ncbi:ADP-ribosylation factor 4 [Castilleja foliolosa]|uniref:Auxin response factor n=1 Tax=Castilleja foliolosa TaxID=1961234 RepID=A0ABD3BH48_9LAMI
MEFDLNDAAYEVGKKRVNACGKCEKSGCVYGCLSNSTNSSSCSSNDNSSSCSSNAQSSLYVELWNACAGPLTSLPKKGNVVVYFPQGHLEQSAAPSSFPPMDLPTFDLPPQIFCRVVNVQLLANKETDEVYTQLSLLPLPELAKLEGKESDNASANEDGNRVLPAKSSSHMFCKTLTASDTSTHGGFSVPRRAAEDCFPPLDYKEQRPSQELVAKDLHGVEWKFRHIYRGQPRRHLLTTGWSIFVSQKNLVSGDAVLFLRGEGGELRLGIRRAARPRNGLPDSIIKNQSCYPNVLSPVANALSTNSPFPVFYSPRASHADFIFPYQKYVKGTTSQISVGTRFKMRFDIDDSPDRRFSGVVTGVGDIDPYRWPNSKWRCLMVRWDEDIMSIHQERVSPWDIDFSGNYAPLSTQSSPRMKKLRSNIAVAPHASPIAAGGGAHFDFEESLRSSKVLQGQENVSLVSQPLYRTDHRMSRQLDFGMMRPTAPNPATPEKMNYGEFMRNHHAGPPSTFTGFLESNWFPKVLQGQEICSFKSLAGKSDLDLSYNNSNARPRLPASSCFYPLASEGSRNISIPQKGAVYRATGQSPPLFLPSFPSSIRSGPTADTSEPRALDKNTNDDDNLKEKVPECKIFGFSLIAEDHAGVNQQGSSKRRCTKVYKQGSLVRRAVDLSKLQGYEELLIDLERLFSMEGLLRDPKNGWRVLYTDSENDMLVVGDDPWHEFVEVVSRIHIYTQEEVEKLSIGINSDDTKSCLEEAVPSVADVSKSSSVGQTDDSSPTVVRI